MTIKEAYNQIEKDKTILHDKIAEIFKTGRFHSAFVEKKCYEKFIIDIFRCHLMTMYPDKFLVNYVTGKEYDEVCYVCHAFKSWYIKLTNGNIESWLKVNHLDDTDKYIDGSPIKSEEIYYQRYLKALEIKNIPNQDVLYRMMNIVTLR